MEKRRKKGWMTLRVQEITRETPDTVTLHFVDNESGTREFDYDAGQYLTFRFDDLSDKPVVRSYTMSSSPKMDQKDLQVTVKEVADPFISKHLVQDVKIGDILRARGPIGKFGYQPNDPPHLVMVAAGSGVTPFISLMREFASTLGQPGSPQSMTLLVSFRTQEDIICKHHLSALQAIDNCNVHISLSRENATDEGFLSGRIQTQHLEQVCLPHIEHGVFMTCGPEAVMNQTVSFLETHQVPKERIKTESFD